MVAIQVLDLIPILQPIIQLPELLVKVGTSAICQKQSAQLLALGGISMVTNYNSYIL
jgi:hypothetical protein